MRSFVPRVASESHSLPPSRPARSQPDVTTKPSASPFTEMLDSAAAPTEASAASAARKARTEPAERSETPKPTETKSADSRAANGKPAEDTANAGAKNTAAPTDSKTAVTTGGSKAAKDVKVSVNTSGNADEATASADADRNPEAATDQVVTPDATSTDAPAPAVTVPQPIAIVAVVASAPTPTLPTIDAGAGASSPGDTLAISATAGQASRGLSTTTPKLAAPQPKPQSQASDGAPGNAPADAATPADPAAAQPKGDAKNVGLQDKDDKAAGEFHRAAVDRIARAGTDAPANQGDPTGAAKISADPGPNTGLLPPAQGPDAPTASSAPAPAQAQSPTPAAAVPLAGLAVEIATQAHGGKNHFEIRLDPPELGRIDVKLDVDRDGNVSTRLVVDRSDTLDLLKRDASTLERALQQAGLKTSDQGLDFSLRQHAFAERDTSAQAGTHLIVPDDDAAPLEALRQGYGRRLGLGGGLDIRV
jgi:flagellar hook-length control protein FliK